ncbi:MAG: GntR family transcriptional regulator [Pseudomonadota bacterium]
MESQDAKETAIEVIQRMVLTMELEPGQPIDEVALAKELGLSRTPLREIIQRLSGEGYLTLEKNRGAKASSMDIATLGDFFQAAPMIYAAVSRLAAERATKLLVDGLKEEQAKFRASLKGGDRRETALHNTAFHRAIGRIANTPYLIASLDRLLIDHTRISLTFFNPSSKQNMKQIETAADQHDQMIDAIERHAPTEAIEITLEHWNLSRDSIERFVRPDPIPFELGALDMKRSAP